MDIEEYLSAKCWDIFDKDRFIYVNCDAYTTTNGEKVKELKPNGFDIIFEDGPHTLQSQIATLEIYLKQLKTGGKLFMEDIQSVDDFDKLEEVVKEMDGKYETERIDLRENKNRYDDLIFVVGKK
jgi:predicted RNA-binding protein